MQGTKKFVFQCFLLTLINSSLTIYFRHVVTKALSAENITEGLVDTFGENPQQINIKKEDGGVQVEFTANGATTTATVVKTNINAKNGIIHEVDNILLETPTPAPTEDLIQALTTAGNFNELIKAITTVGLTEDLKNITAATIFAPNDDAFKKLPTGTIEGLTPEELEKIISR